MFYDNKQQAFIPKTRADSSMPKVNLHEVLPENVRSLRFNQKEIANRFGTFTNFVKDNKALLDENKNKDLLQLLGRKEHVSGFGGNKQA